MSISLTTNLNWKKELNKTALRYHTITLWVAVVFNLLFFITDYINIYEYWQEFLSFRVVVAFICLITVLFHKRLHISIEMMAVIPVLLISIENAYMWSVMDAEHLQKHTLAYMALFIGSGMFVFYATSYSIFIVVASIIANVLFFYVNSNLSVDEVLVNGGFLTLAVAIFSILLIRMRYSLTKKEIIARLELEKSKQLIEEKHKEITDSINYAERIQRSFMATTEILDKYLNPKHVIANCHPELVEGTAKQSVKNEQIASLPSVIRNDESNYFVFFRPKDVVSGDFYWASELINGNFAFSCADSTGHGVPGAIMSILNISSLEKSIEKETEPDQILNKTRKIIIERLKKDGSLDGGKDGMDCSLLVINKDRTQLSFAAANNPVFILRPIRHSQPQRHSALDSESVQSNCHSEPVEEYMLRQDQHDKNDMCNDDNLEPPRPSRKGTFGRETSNFELIEFKPDKMPVGKHDNDAESFTLHTTNLQNGDVIYALTDGFPDQFGGDKGKKYRINNLKDLLLQIAHLSMLEQEQKLAEEFDKWKGSNEQVDDVCIIGVRI